MTVTNCSIYKMFTYLNSQLNNYIPENVHGTVYVSSLKTVMHLLSRANHKGVNNSVTGVEIACAGSPCMQSSSLSFR